MSRSYPDWYYQTTADPKYPGIDENMRELVYLLRNNGWNTISSCGHEFEGIVVMACYHEQSGGMLDSGGVVFYLRNFLKSHGYEHFEITRKVYQWHGQIVEDVIILKLLDSKWDARW